MQIQSQYNLHSIFIQSFIKSEFFFSTNAVTKSDPLSLKMELMGFKEIR